MLWAIDGRACSLLLMVVRPALSRLMGRKEQGRVPMADAELALGNEHALPSIAQSKEDSPQVSVLGGLNPLSEICLPAPGSGLELQIEHLQMLAKNDPEPGAGRQISDSGFNPPSTDTRLLSSLLWAIDGRSCSLPSDTARPGQDNH